METLNEQVRELLPELVANFFQLSDSQAWRLIGIAQGMNMARKG